MCSSSSAHARKSMCADSEIDIMLSSKHIPRKKVYDSDEENLQIKLPSSTIRNTLVQHNLSQYPQPPNKFCNMASSLERQKPVIISDHSGEINKYLPITTDTNIQEVENIIKQSATLQEKLARDLSSEGGSNLAECVRRRMPLALTDEDYKILIRVIIESAMLMIGVPTKANLKKCFQL
ncbi:hypothetical protein RN001_001850 [Aquatica leii]|uniref:Uncharacterized protein n=1 Tax=Aquatica leii TaxID=1421715 RepID=A0AAN7PGE1_9COLE|nr:hypothetical protein RN001_001850 [Aquatica leii]